MVAMATKRKNSDDARPTEATTSDDAANRFMEEAQRQVDFLFSPSVMLPGDDVTDIVTKTSKIVRLGSGLRQIGKERIVCTNAGVLRYRPPNRYWIDHEHKRYSIAVNDGVIGIVTDRNADCYRVNIGGSGSVILGCLAFDGATKRNRPMLRIGSLVYARVLKTNLGSEAELTCEAPPNVTKKDWMTGLSIFGELTGGYVFKTSVTLARKLLHDDSHILVTLGKMIAFEIAIGLNGVVWVNSRSTKETTIVSSAILNSESMSDNEIDLMVQQLITDNGL